MPTARPRSRKNSTRRAGSAPAAGGANGAAGSPVSPALSEAIRALTGEGRLGGRPTLTDLRKALQAGLSWNEGEIQCPQDRTALVIELDELIDRFGARAGAEDCIGSAK